MQRRQTLIALLIASAYPLMSVASADVVWHGSYSVGEQCYCSGDLDSSVATQIVPTPIGGQTVKQVCAKVGAGPELSVDNGIFNYTVYKDPQCGHGPFVNARAPRDADCVGTVDGTYGSCQSAGPRWALANAYDVAANSAVVASNNGKSAAEELAVKDKEKTPSLSAAVPEKGAIATGASKNVQADSRDSVLAAFKGRSVMLGDDRYLQARDGIPAQGGAAGSRIILDGKLFLREDENLNVADLYQAESTPEVAAAQPTQTPVKPLSGNKVTAKSSAKDRLEKEQAKRDAQARLEGQKAQREAKARFEAQARLAAQARVEANAQRDIQLRREKQARLEAQSQQEAQALRDSQKAQREAQARADFLAQQQALKDRLAKQAANSEVDAPVKIQSVTIVDAPLDAPSEKNRTKQKLDVASDTEALSEASRQVKKPVDETKSSATDSPTVLSALRLPVGTRASSRDFAYLEAMPASYDIGGAGIVLEGSAQSNSRFQYLGRLGVSDTYQEVMIGGGYYVTPESATRMTVVLLAGVEFGSFELRDDIRAPGLEINSTDSGLYVGAMSRIVINNKFELKGGIGYSTFFEGDAMLFGGGYYHVTPRLDVMSRFELGDNDLLGIGIRYYY